MHDLSFCIMENKMLTTPSSTRENDTTMTIVGELSSSNSQLSNDEFSRIPIKTKGKLQEEAAQIVSQKFQNAKPFLKERLTISIQRRHSRFLDWQQQDERARALRRNARNLDTLEAQQSGERSQSENGPAKPATSLNWENELGFPKPPKVESSESHFLCQICSLSTPSEQAVGDLWVQHVIQDIVPYICIHESCQSPQTTFSSFEEWADHMKEESDSKPDVLKLCPLCSHEPSGDDEKLPAATLHHECLQQHVATHLWSLALASLPPLSSDSEPRLKGSDAPKNSIPPQIEPPVPRTPFVTPMFERRPVPLVFGPISMSVPGGPETEFARRRLQNATHKGPTSGQAWRPQDGQSTEIETFDVLVADDNTVNQRVLFKFLQKLHHTVVVVSNGQEALDAVKQRKYDVVLMDISMPVMSGFEATGKIREYERNMGHTRTPVIGLIVNAMNRDLESVLLEAQLDGVISKPIPFRKLSEKVAHYGRLGRLAAGNDVHQFLASIPGRTGAIRCPARKLGAKL